MPPALRQRAGITCCAHPHVTPQSLHAHFISGRVWPLGQWTPQVVACSCIEGDGPQVGPGAGRLSPASPHPSLLPPAEALDAPASPLGHRAGQVGSMRPTRAPLPPFLQPGHSLARPLPWSPGSQEIPPSGSAPAPSCGAPLGTDAPPGKPTAARHGSGIAAPAPTPRTWRYGLTHSRAGTHRAPHRF